MTCLSSLANDLTTLILDTSVLINLHACSFGEQILSALPNTILIPEVVARELTHETSKINGEHYFLEELISNGKIQVVEFDDNSWKAYDELTKSSPSLGDGESAVIAIARAKGVIPVIDDGKGRSRVLTTATDKKPAWTLDLLTHPEVRAALTETHYIEAIYLALSEGRMRIAPEQCDSVVELIGCERALLCTSLPGYKTKRTMWERGIDSLPQINITAS